MSYLRAGLAGLWLVLAWASALQPYLALGFFGRLMADSFLFATALFYVLPIIEGALKKHPDLPRIAAVDLLLGWTVIGWLWAYKTARSAPKVKAPPKPKPSVQAAPAAAPKPAVFVAPTNHLGPQVADRLQKARDLYVVGVYTEEEYAAQKASILGSAAS